MRKITLEEIADMENEIQRLRGQIAELLPWAVKALDAWEIDNRRYDSEESELLSRISAGEFGEV
jgi:N-acyl-L-homoserine lactone synthetase